MAEVRKVVPMAVPFQTDVLVVTLRDDFRQRDLEELIETTNAVLAMSNPQRKEIFQEFYEVGKQLVYCRSDRQGDIMHRHLQVRRVVFAPANYC